MANCRVFSCSLSLSSSPAPYIRPSYLSLFLPFPRAALLVSSSRNICPRARGPLSLLRSLIRNESSLYPSGARKSQTAGLLLWPNYPGNSGAQGRTPTWRAVIYPVYPRLAAIEIIPVDTHARRLIALGFDAAPSANRAIVIRSAKR